MSANIKIFDIMYERAQCDGCGWQLDHSDPRAIDRAIDNHAKICLATAAENELHKHTYEANNFIS